MIRVLFLFIAVFSGSWIQAQDKDVRSGVYRWDDLKVEKSESRKRGQILKGTTTDLESLEVHTSTLAPGKSPHASHTHKDEEELIIIKEGNLKVTIKDQSKILGPGSIAFAIPGEEHGFENGGDVPVTYYILKYKSKTAMDIDRGRKGGGSFMIDWKDIAEIESEKGSRRNFFERPTTTSQRFEMHVTTLKEGLNSHAPHKHRAEEIVLMIRGDVKMQIGEKIENASAGDLIFLGSDVLHNLMNVGKGSCSYFAFQW